MRLFRGRKHPIKRDESGRSARQRAFALFEEGLRPAEVARITRTSPRTIFRYFQDFRASHSRLPYQVLRRWVRENPEFSEQVIAMLANTLGMSKEAVSERAQRPWGLLQGLRGGWPNYQLEQQRTEIENRLLAALELLQFCETFSQRDPQFVRQVLKQIIMERGEQAPEDT